MKQAHDRARHASRLRSFFSRKKAPFLRDANETGFPQRRIRSQPKGCARRALPSGKRQACENFPPVHAQKHRFSGAKPECSAIKAEKSRSPQSLGSLRLSISGTPMSASALIAARLHLPDIDRRRSLTFTSCRIADNSIAFFSAMSNAFAQSGKFSELRNIFSARTAGRRFSLAAGGGFAYNKRGKTRGLRVV